MGENRRSCTHASADSATADTVADIVRPVTHCRLALLFLVLLLLQSMPVRASEPMAAELLFDDGVEHMKAHRFEVACPKIAESQRLEPRAGTLFTLAECWARAGRLATALARYREYLRVFRRMSVDEQTGQRGREAIAREQIGKLASEVPSLTIQLARTAPRKARVKRDGVELGTPSLGRPLPVDPGLHVITGSVPGGPVSTVRITLAPGENETVTLEVAPAPLRSLPSRERREPALVPPPPRQQVDDSMSSHGIAAIVFTGLASIGVVAGTVTGILVLDNTDEIRSQCGLAGDPAACTASGKAAADGAQALATASTIAFVAAGASGALGLTFFLLERGEGADSPAISPRAALLTRW